MPCWHSFIKSGFACVAMAIAACTASAAASQAGNDADKTVCSSDVGCDVPPKRLTGEAPVYPRKELESGKTGKVVLLFTVNPDETTSDFQVESTTTKGFAEASIAAIKQWKYEPAKFHDQPIKWQVRLNIPFVHGRWDE